MAGSVTIASSGWSVVARSECFRMLGGKGRDVAVWICIFGELRVLDDVDDWLF
jgi:hypothetical protein